MWGLFHREYSRTRFHFSVFLSSVTEYFALNLTRLKLQRDEICKNCCQKTAAHCVVYGVSAEFLLSDCGRKRLLLARAACTISAFFELLAPFHTAEGHVLLFRGLSRSWGKTQRTCHKTDFRLVDENLFRFSSAGNSIHGLSLQAGILSVLRSLQFPRVAKTERTLRFVLGQLCCAFLIYINCAGVSTMRLLSIRFYGSGRPTCFESVPPQPMKVASFYRRVKSPKEKLYRLLPSKSLSSCTLYSPRLFSNPRLLCITQILELLKSHERNR
jgi:hypothetical protein